MKQRKSRITHRHRWAVGCICVMTVFIVALNVVCLLCTSVEFVNAFFETNIPYSPVSYEDAFLGNALSLIGIAISVWAALNIVNALDKNDVEVLQEQLHQLQVESEAVIATQHRNALFQLFEQCSLDLGMKHISQRMSRIPDLPCAQLSIVMQYYIRIYDLHKKQQDGSALFVSVANEAIDYIGFLLNQKKFSSNRDVCMFFHYCLAEIHFYCSYSSRGNQSYNHAHRALQEYDMALPLFGMELPTYSAKQMINYPSQQIRQMNSVGVDKVLLAYLCNTYGECYSKVVQALNHGAEKCDAAETRETWGRKSIFYCENAVQLAEAAGTPEETYWRNLGCAIEATYLTSTITNEKIQNRVWETYDKAMHIGILKNQIPEKLFYAWLSFYHKCINDTYIQKTLKNPEEGGMPPGFVYLLNAFSERALIYADLARKKYADKIVYRKHHVFALRDAYLRESMHGNKKPARNFLKEFKKEYGELVQLYVTSYEDEGHSQDSWDDFMRELKSDFDNLYN